MPILTYCSQTWAPNTTQCKSIERVQKTAMRWIAPTESTYKKRLLLTHLLPVTLYLELHDLLYLLRRTDSSTTENQENDNSKTTSTCSEGPTARQLKIKRTTTAKRQDSTPEANGSFQNTDCKRQTITSPTERKSYLMQLSSPSVTRLPMKFSSQQSPPCQIFSGATSKRSMTNSFLAPGVSCAAVDTATQTRSCDSPTPQKGDKPMGWTTHAQKPTLLLLLQLV